MGVVNISKSTLIWFVGFTTVFFIGSILSFSFMIATNVSSTGGKTGPSGPQGIQGKDGICNFSDPNSTSAIVVQSISVLDILEINGNSGISFQNDSHGIEDDDEECLLIYSVKGICVDSPKITHPLTKGITPSSYIPNISTSIFYLSTQICFTENCSVGIGPSLNSTKLKLYGFEDINEGINFPLFVKTNGIIDGGSNHFKLTSISEGIKIDTNGYGIYSNDLIYNDPVFFNDDLWLLNGQGIHLTSTSPNVPFSSAVASMFPKVFSIMYLNDSLLYTSSYLMHESNIMAFLGLEFPNNVSILQSLTSSVLLKNKKSLIISSEESISLLSNATLHLGVRYLEFLNNSFINSNLALRGAQRKITFTRNGINNVNLNSSGPPYSTLFASIEANDDDDYCPLTLKPSVCVDYINISNQLFLNVLKLFYNATGSKENGPALMIQLHNGSPIELVVNSGYFENLTTNTLNIIGYSQFPNGISAQNFILTGGGTLTGGTTSDVMIVTNQFNSNNVTSISGSLTSIQTTTTNIQSNVNFLTSTTVKCDNPIFFTSANSAFPCLPDCLDFYQCTLLNSIGLKARNVLTVASSTNEIKLKNSSSTEAEPEPHVIFGTDIDYILQNQSTLTNVTIRTNKFIKLIGVNGSKERNLGTIDIRSFRSTSTNLIKKINLGTFGEQKSMSALPSDSCLPVINMQRIDSTIFTLPPPYFNYTASTCSSVSEYYKISNISILIDGNMLLTSAVLKRTCSSTYNSAFCSPFFEWFVDEMYLKEIILATYNTTTKIYTKPDGPFTFKSDEIKRIRDSYVEILDSTGDTFQNQSIANFILAILNQNFSLPQIPDNTETYSISSYTYINMNGSNGIQNISSSQALDLAEGLVLINKTNQTIKINGPILNKDGNTHSCCITSTILNNIYQEMDVMLSCDLTSACFSSLPIKIIKQNKLVTLVIDFYYVITTATTAYSAVWTGLPINYQPRVGAQVLIPVILTKPGGVYVSTLLFISGGILTLLPSLASGSPTFDVSSLYLIIYASGSYYSP